MKDWIFIFVLLLSACASSPSAFIKSRQASWGIQAGIQRAELVLLVMTNKGLKQIIQDAI